VTQLVCNTNRRISTRNGAALQRQKAGQGEPVNLRSVVRAVPPLVSSLYRDPGESLHAVASVPLIVRGTVRTRHWGAVDKHDEPRIGPESELRNPLRTYVDTYTDGPGIWKWDHYFDAYHRYLQKFVGRDAHIVEIGVYSGGSLRLWKHYFGQAARVYGIDIQPECKAYEDERTKVFIGDQADRGFWRRFREQVPDIDVIIDDGGHSTEQQIVTLEETLPYMRGGGVYICEDVHGQRNGFTTYLFGLANALNTFDRAPADELAAQASALQQQIHAIHLHAFMIVIEKSEVPLNRLVAPRRGNVWQPFPL
jgi:Methyltransferase domain